MSRSTRERGGPRRRVVGGARRRRRARCRGPLRLGSDAGARALGRASQLGRGAPRGLWRRAAGRGSLGPCSPRPQKVFGIGLNYRESRRGGEARDPEAAARVHEVPELSGRAARATWCCRPSASTTKSSWSSVIGRRGRGISESRALDARRRLSASGQDISDRALQFADKPPQFSLGKSVDRLRADRAGRGVARRVRRPRRPARSRARSAASGCRRIGPAT